MKYFLTLILFLAISCKKDKSCEKCINDPLVTNGIIIYTGPLSTDGCDWLVKVNDSINYHPDFLDPVFQHDQLKVKVTYQLTSDVYICGIAGLHIPVIHINSMVKR